MIVSFSLSFFYFQMTKRPLEDASFANVLRQKPKEDISFKHQNAKQTVQLLMNAQRNLLIPQPNNDNNNNTLGTCYRCSHNTCIKCTYCEHVFCNNCIQQCITCQLPYCTTCSEIDYSQPMEQVFCFTCKQT
ncbi:unnamed protein product [Rhizopus microsporus]